MPYQFLVASWGGAGHLGPALTAAQQLRDRGHGVRFIAREDARAAVEAAGYSFATWRRTPRFVPVAAGSDPLHQICDQVLFGPAGARAADTRDEIARLPTDALLSDVGLFGSGSAAEAAGIPCALLSPTVAFRPLPGVPPIRSRLPSPRTSAQRALVDAANGALAAMINRWLPMLNAARADLGLPPFDDVMELFDRPARHLLAVSAAFDFPADSLPHNMRHIGPLLDGVDWAEAWTPPWPDAMARPRALISFSTTDQNQSEALQRTVNAIAGIDMHGVATAGPALQVAKLQAPRNVTLLPSAPHDAVMKQVSLVVTHGGHGTVSRALSHGLPLLVMPMGRDQDAVAARVEFHGAGLMLPPTASEPDIAAAVRRLIDEPQFGIAARRLAKFITREIDARCLVGEMEGIVAGGFRALRARH